MIHLWLWRRASSILWRDLPRLALAGRWYQQTRQLYALYMLWDKIRRRGLSDKTVKDYLSFGGLVVICYQNGFCVRGKKRGMTGLERRWKQEKKMSSEGRQRGIAGGRMRGGCVVIQGGFCFLFNFSPLPPHSIQRAKCQSHFELDKQTQQNDWSRQSK